MSINQNSGVIAAGLALFSMFFGAGDLIWPLILGGSSGNQNFFAMLGLLITGVSLPLLGLIAMMLFEGDYHAFFGKVGKKSSIALIFIIQAILGPIGTIPRAITLSYATLRPYLPENIDLLFFSVLTCIVILAFTIKPQKVIDLLGLILTPVLLLSLGAILILGFVSHPEPQVIAMGSLEAFSGGIKVGYNTLDLIASFIFAPLVMTHFIMKTEEEQDPKIVRKNVFKKMVKASLIAAGLLSLMYIGLTYVSSFYTPHLESGHKPEERLSLIAMLLLGPKGALVSCIAVALACLTTAIPIVSICSDYIREDLFRNKTGPTVPLLITLAISTAIANMGFMGIASMLSPVLQILCPGLIVLSLMNIVHKLYEKHLPRTPIFATFALSTIGYVF
jgi:LIVCS family branched-chain amino acid:cation transporter